MYEDIYDKKKFHEHIPELSQKSVKIFFSKIGYVFDRRYKSSHQYVIEQILILFANLVFIDDHVNNYEITSYQKIIKQDIFRGLYNHQEYMFFLLAYSYTHYDGIKASKILNSIGLSRRSKVMIILYLLQLANSDGVINEKEYDIIYHISKNLEFTRIEFQKIIAKFFLAENIDIMSVHKKKRKNLYRKLVKKYHPDSFIHSNLDDYCKDILRQKFLMIRDSYHTHI